MCRAVSSSPSLPQMRNDSVGNRAGDKDRTTVFRQLTAYGQSGVSRCRHSKEKVAMVADWSCDLPNQTQRPPACLAPEVPISKEDRCFTSLYRNLLTVQGLPP